MKPTFALPLPWCLIGLLAAGGSPARAESTQKSPTNSTDKSAAKLTAPEPVVPPSQFEVPKTPAAGRDPFFPNSTRPYGTPAVTAKAPAVPSVDSLVLKAVAGSRNNRFASINGVDFSEGEVREVATPGGRIRVRCVKIESDSATVEVGDARRTLRLRGGF